MTINITGASQRVQQNGKGEWEACYICHKCGEEFASVDLCKEEAVAREQSNTKFDKQHRRFCYRCGYKLTDKESVSENEEFARLNYEIDKLEKENRELVEQKKILENALLEVA